MGWKLPETGWVRGWHADCMGSGTGAVPGFLEANMNATTNTNATNKTIATTVAPDGGLTGNGSLRIDVVGFPTLTMQLRDLSDAMVEQAALHGLKQKIVDAAALSRNPDTGRSATAAKVIRLTAGVCISPA